MPLLLREEEVTRLREAVKAAGQQMDLPLLRFLEANGFNQVHTFRFFIFSFYLFLIKGGILISPLLCVMSAFLFLFQSPLVSLVFLEGRL